MAVETTAELLDFVKDMSGLPSVNDEMTATKWYRLLTLAQKEIVRLLATHAPGSQFGDPELLTSADGGYTYSLASYPYGRVELRESRTGALLSPGNEWDYGSDFVVEGQTIRWVNNQQRTFDDGPYARYAPEAGDIDANTDPTMKPASARILIAWRALEMWCARGRLRDPAFYHAEYQRGLFGDPNTPGVVGLIPELKVQYLNQGGLDGYGVPAHWTKGLTGPGFV